MGKVIQKYNGVETAKHSFNFDNIKQVQLTRDAEDEGAKGMSATKLREMLLMMTLKHLKGITDAAQE